MSIEQSPNTYVEPMSRLKKIARKIFNQLQDPTPSEHFRPSPQRDVGKTATKAANVQLTIEGLNAGQEWSDFHGTASQPRHDV